MTSFNRYVTDHPWQVIVAFVLATAVFAVRVPRLVVDFDVDAVFPPEHPEVAYKKWVHEYFAIDEPVIVMIVNDGPEGVFTPETLALVKFVSDEMRQLEGIDGDDLVSLSEVDNITADDDSLIVEPFFEQPPATQLEADAVRATVLANPMMLGTVVTRDGRATIVAGEMIDGADKVGLHTALRDIVARAPHGQSKLVISGRPVVEGEMTEVTNTEVTRVMPIVVATAAGVLALALHSVRGVLLPLLVVLTSIVWTAGLMAWTGYPFSALNTPLPMMLVPIGIADGIHVIHHYMHTVADDPETPNRDAVFETMQGMFTAVVMTSLTTAAGVGSLATSSVSTNRDFGVFAAFGVLAAMVFSLTVLPALLVLLPRPRRGVARFVRSASTERGPIRRMFEMVAVLVTDRPRAVVAATVLLVLLAASGFPMLTVDGSLLKNLPPDNGVRISDKLIVERFGGSVPLEIILDGGGRDGWKQPENLRALDAFQAGLEGRGDVGKARSIADYIRRMNAVMNPDDPSANRIPDTAELVAQYLLLYSISGEPDDFDDVVDYDYALANVRAQAVSDHSPDLGRLLRGIDELADEHLAPLGIEAHASGTAREIYEFMYLIVTSQLTSLATALLLVWVMAAIMLRSMVGGFLTALPVLIATVATFGALGWVGEPVGVTTAILGAIAIGIGVDFAVHFVVRYRERCRRETAPGLAMRETLYTSGVAIFYNAVVVIAGFLAMATSEFLPPHVMGLLVSWNMLVCFAATVTTLAALLAWLDPKFVRAPDAYDPS